MMKGEGRGEVHELRRGEWGRSWQSYPDEEMERASVALATDGGTWLVDPLDAAGLDDWLPGEVAGVVVLSDYHRRDAAAIAERNGVPVTVPDWFDLSLAVDTASLAAGESLPGTDYELRFVADDAVWAEGALYDGETLVATESLVSADYDTLADERLAVSPFRRLAPPRSAFADCAPERVLTGHGPGVVEDADGALAAALSNARSGAPSFYLRNLPGLVRGVWSAALD